MIANSFSIETGKLYYGIGAKSVYPQSELRESGGDLSRGRGNVSG